MTKLYEAPYKDKWFILTTEPEDDWFGELEEINIQDIDLEEHVANCLYYGIPPLIDRDNELPELNAQIEAIYEKINERN